MNIRETLERKLFDAIHELKTRARENSSTQIQVQRMFGVVLGIRIALMEYNKLEYRNPHAFAGSDGIERLIQDGFGQLSRTQIREYAFPTFGGLDI